MALWPTFICNMYNLSLSKWVEHKVENLHSWSSEKEMVQEEWARWPNDGWNIMALEPFPSQYQYKT